MSEKLNISVRTTGTGTYLVMLPKEADEQAKIIARINENLPNKKEIAKQLVELVNAEPQKGLFDDQVKELEQFKSKVLELMGSDEPEIVLGAIAGMNQQNADLLQRNDQWISLMIELFEIDTPDEIRGCVQAINASLKTMGDQIKSYVQENERLKDELKSLNDNYDTLKHERDDAEKEIKRLEEANEKLKNECDTHMRQIDRMQKEIEKLKSKGAKTEGGNQTQG